MLRLVDSSFVPDRTPTPGTAALAGSPRFVALPLTHRRIGTRTSGPADIVPPRRSCHCRSGFAMTPSMPRMRQRVMLLLCAFLGATTVMTGCLIAAVVR